MQGVLGEADAVMGPGDTTGCGDVHMQILAMMRMLCACAYSFARVAKHAREERFLDLGWNGVARKETWDVMTYLLIYQSS